LLLLDVTSTFFGTKDVLHVAITSQITTVSSALAVVAGIAIAVLSVRVRRRKLLLFGAALIPIGSVGCLLAPNFLALSIFFPFDGVGSIIVGSMAFALAGETLSLRKRAKAMGWIVSGATWAQFFGAVLIRYFFAAGDWRSFLLWYSLPVSTFAFFFVYFCVPKVPFGTEGRVSESSYFRSFKEVFLNKSATACLIGNMVRHAGMIWGIVYGATFLRIVFNQPLTNAALVVLCGTLAFALGSVLGGQVAHRVGRKHLAVSCITMVGAFFAGAVYAPNVWISVAFSLAANFGGGAASAGTLNMTVEQVPKKRGTIMSMSSVFVTLGATIGAALGGAMLAFSSNFQITALAFVGLDFAAAGIYLLFTVDPCRTSRPK